MTPVPDNELVVQVPLVGLREVTLRVLVGPWYSPHSVPAASMPTDGAE